jgi:hypothetical protein
VGRSGLSRRQQRRRGPKGPTQALAQAPGEVSAPMPVFIRKKVVGFEYKEAFETALKDLL